MDLPTIEPLPIVRVANVKPVLPTERWLATGLWAHHAVGIVGGSPKSGKTWLALDLAVAVASGRPCLGRFRVEKPGPVLLFAAEDSPSDVRERVRNIAAARGTDLDRLPLGLVTEIGFRLDSLDYQRRLRVTLDRVRPRLLVLDPLVRLHRGDENSAADVSDLLGFLRCLQREFDLAVCLVHHIRKSAAAHPGQALRGSGDLHAWTDSGLYLLRQKDGCVLHIEHRANPSPPPLRLALQSDPTRLEVTGPVQEPDDAPPGSVEARVVEVLAKGPATRSDLRDRLRVRNESLGLALRSLEVRGAIALRNGHWAVPVPAP